MADPRRRTLAPALLLGLALADIDLPADVSFPTFGDSPAAYRSASQW